MANEMKTMTSNIQSLNGQTSNLLEMLRNMTGSVKSGRDGVYAGIKGVEEKMKKAGFNLSQVQVKIFVDNACDFL